MARRATDLDDYVGKRIRQRRIELGLSQNELADALGVSFQQIQKYENGINRVSAGRLYAATQHLITTLDYFFEGVELLPANQPVAGGNDKRVIALVRSFTRISDAGTRSAVARLVGSIADSEAPQARPRKGHR